MFTEANVTDLNHVLLKQLLIRTNHLYTSYIGTPVSKAQALFVLLASAFDVQTSSDH